MEEEGVDVQGHELIFYGDAMESKEWSNQIIKSVNTRYDWKRGRIMREEYNEQYEGKLKNEEKERIFRCDSIFQFKKT